MKKLFTVLIIILLSTVSFSIYIYYNRYSNETMAHKNNDDLRIDQSYLEINKAVEQLSIALETKNFPMFYKLTSPSGLIIIRNFLTGGSGVRGKDIRSFYSKDRITGLLFPVEGEIPVDPSELFVGTLQKHGKGIPIEKADFRLDLHDNGKTYPPEPTTSKIAEVCFNLRNNSDAKDSDPRIFVLDGDTFLLGESVLFNDFALGAWAIFKKEGSKYYLKALIDFR